MKKTNVMKRVLCGTVGIVMTMASLSACGSAGDPNTIKFLYKGSVEQIDMYIRMVELFNETYGQEHGITVKPVDATANYAEVVKLKAGDTLTDPFDVFLVEDAELKTWITYGYCCEIQSYLDDITEIDVAEELGKMMPTTYERLRYNLDTNTSNDGDPLYGLPLDTQPTALYYNESLFEAAGIITISVDEEDIVAWNNNEVADKRGNYKRDYPALADYTIPAKGFYRSETPYYYDDVWMEPWQSASPTEVLVFNNRIAMNWDEVEDLAMFFSGVSNPADGETTKKEPTSKYGSKYGYFTEWWFNYGWSVGGDCLQDMTGQGEWNFSLLDPNPNYVVKNGPYTGRITGRTYQTGETLDFKDKMDITQGELLEADVDGNYLHADGSTATISSDVTALATGTDDSTLAELPSTRDAFVRYLLLGTKNANYCEVGETTSVLGRGGLGISMNPEDLSGTNTLLNNFYTGNLAMMANTALVMPDVAQNMSAHGRKWDVAPLAVYKEYANPDEPQCDGGVTCDCCNGLVARGKDAGHSNTTTMLIRAKSEKKKVAAQFIMWMASEDAHALRASRGYYPNQAHLVDDIDYSNLTYAPSNIVAFAEALDYQTPGDWWYMPDHFWVEQWCVELNSYVRTGKRSYDEWISGEKYSAATYEGTAYMPVVQRTNKYLKEQFNDKNYQRS